MSLPKQLIYNDLLNHLKCHQPEFYEIIQLYQHPSACAAVFGELPELAKHFILRVLFLEQPIPLSWAMTWINNDNLGEKDAIIKVLREMNILVAESIDGNPMFKLQDDFKRNLRTTIGGAKEDWLGMKSMEKDKHTKDVEFLDQYARKRWECILHFMCQAERGEQILSDIVVEILVHAGFIQLTGVKSHNITPLGFQFLLLDVTKQVWVFVLKFLEILRRKGVNYQECLLLLFRLNFLPSGQDYSTTNISESMLTVFQYLREFGLVYQRMRKCQRFSVTRLACNLTTRTCEEIKLQANEDAGLIVDNDYTINACDPSGTLGPLLDMFTVDIFRCEGRKICQIVRDSCMNALREGITANQLVHFLRLNASKVTANTEHCVPPTVVDQIRLWEAELNKIKTADGVLYKDFKSPDEFERFRNNAAKMKAILWANQAKRMIVITREGHMIFQANMNRQRN